MIMIVLMYDFRAKNIHRYQIKKFLRDLTEVFENYAMAWRERVELDANPVMTFPIKKMINAELFMDSGRSGQWSFA